MTFRQSPPASSHSEHRPEAIIRKIIDSCADCDTCRFLMNEDCRFFPELYRLADHESETGRPCGDDELNDLTQWCTLCGLCPCPDIRNMVMRAKAAQVRRRGLPFGRRLLADVQMLGRYCGMAPKPADTVMQSGVGRWLAERCVDMHRNRCLPRIPDENFFKWARRRGLCGIPAKGSGVAYFAGCTAGYLFPEVAKAAVTMLQHCGVAVAIPDQSCCGMPALVEGDERTTRKRVQANLDTLLSFRRMGFEPVTSCPTCGFLFKVLLKEGAYHSDDYQRSIGTSRDEIRIPHSDGGGRFVNLKKSIYGGVLRDEGLFSTLNPLARIALSDSFHDIGECIVRLFDNSRLSISSCELSGRMVYFAPCHQREQRIGSPYSRLLDLVPGLTVEPVGGAMDCCGMGGSLGFKKSFYDTSIALGASLMAKIKAADPQAVITDCLSCRLQFQHLLPFPVFHPLEILARAIGPGNIRA